MDYKKYRWSKDYEAAEEELEKLLARLQHKVGRHEAAALEPLDTKLDAPQRIWCAEGSMALTTKSNTVSLQPGDTINITGGAADSAVAGVAGCVWYEDAL